MCFENGLPRQSADWLAMTGFFDSLRPYPPAVGAAFSAFRYFRLLRDLGESLLRPDTVYCSSLTSAP